MIPSQNDQTLTKESWEMASRSNIVSDSPRWACDCCLKSFPDPEGQLSYERPDGNSLAPFIREIGGVKYFSCSQACARILFMIHSQYFMRETAQRERFVTVSPMTDRMDSGTPIVLDLDTISSISTNLDEVKDDGCWVRFYWQGYGIPTLFGGDLARKEAQRIMDLWKKKPWRGNAP